MNHEPPPLPVALAEALDWAWAYAAARLAKHLRLRRLPPVPRPVTLIFRQESSAMPKVFTPVAVLPPVPTGTDIAEQVIRFAVDGGEEQAVAIPLSETEQEFELPLQLQVGQRFAGSLIYIDDVRNASAPATFDETITAEMDTTPPEAPTGLRFAYRQSFVPDEA